MAVVRRAGFMIWTPEGTEAEERTENPVDNAENVPVVTFTVIDGR